MLGLEMSIGVYNFILNVNKVHYRRYNNVEEGIYFQNHHTYTLLQCKD